MLLDPNESLYVVDVAYDTELSAEDPNQRWEQNFRTHMKRLRDKSAMTQTELARQLRGKFGLPFHQQTIQRIESGERPVRVNEAYLIADLFGVSVDSMAQVGPSSDVELRWATERLRDESANVAAGLGDLRAQWEERVADWAFSLSQRLAAERQGVSFADLDEVTRWGLMWATWVAPAGDSLVAAHTLISAVGEAEVDGGRSDDMWNEIEGWSAWVQESTGEHLFPLPEKLAFPGVSDGEHPEAP